MSDNKGLSRGRGKRRRGGRRGDEWKPLTRLGRLVKSGAVRSFDEIFKFSMPIKEPQIVDHIAENYTKNNFEEEVMKVKPVQKQTKAGQRTRFKSWVLIGDRNGHIGIGQKADKEVQGAIKGAMQLAKMNLIPVRMGYWGNKLGKPHTIPIKMTGKNGSVRVRLIPAPRGTGIVGAPVSKKVLQMAGVQDCYTATIGQSRTRGNFLFAVYNALSNINNFLTPDLWGNYEVDVTPFEKFDGSEKK